MLRRKGTRKNTLERIVEKKRNHREEKVSNGCQEERNTSGKTSWQRQSRRKRTHQEDHADKEDKTRLSRKMTGWKEKENT